MNWKALAAAAVVLGASAPASAQSPHAPLAGTWDLFWQTRQGRIQKGWLVIRQSGSRVTAEIHGRGHLRANGTADGDAFAVHGRRMDAPFTISGRLHEDRLLGSVKVLSVDRRFEGVRRD